MNMLASFIRQKLYYTIPPSRYYNRSPTIKALQLQPRTTLVPGPYPQPDFLKLFFLINAARLY